MGDVRTAATLGTPTAEQSRARDPRQELTESVHDEPRPTTRGRHLAQVEAELAEAHQAIAQQRREFDEDASSFAQAIARLSHSERTLGQTKAKLLDALERAERAETRSTELSAALVELEALQCEAGDERERAVRRANEESASKLQLRDAEIARLHEAVGAALDRELAHEQALEKLRAKSEAQRQELEAAQTESEARRRELEAAHATGEAQRQELETAHEWTSRALAQEKALRDMAESLSRDSAAGAAECARLTETLKAAERREQLALSDTLKAQADLSSSGADLAESRRREAQLIERCNELELERDRALTNEVSAQNELAQRDAQSQRREAQLLERCSELEIERDRALTNQASAQSELAQRDAQLALAQRDVAGADLERSHFIGVFGALEALGRQIVAVGVQARTEANATSAMVREPVPECEPVTLKPGAGALHPPRSLRLSTAPEILIDGVRLERA